MKRVGLCFDAATHVFAAILLQSAASLFIPAAVNSAMRAALLVITALMGRLLRVRDGRAGGLEWLGIGVSTLGAAIIAGNQVRPTATF